MGKKPSADEKMNLAARALVVWWRFARKCSRQGPLTAAAPWLGTMFGSLVLSGSQGNAWLVLTGALVATVGVLPVIAGGMWTQRDQQREDLYEARERKVVQYAASRLQELASLATRPRSERVDVKEDAITDSVAHLLDEIYSESHGLRAVVYGVSDDQEKMTVLLQAGRLDEARDFERGTPRGDIAFRRLEGSDESYFREKENAEPGEDVVGRGYSSYVAAPIRSDDEAYGMLTLDTANPGSLDKRDADLLFVLASLLSVYFAEAKRGKHNAETKREKQNKSSTVETTGRDTNGID